MSKLEGDILPASNSEDFVATVAMAFKVLFITLMLAPIPTTTVPYGGGRIGDTTDATFGTIFLIVFQVEVNKPLTRAQNLDAVVGIYNIVPHAILV